MTKLLYYFWQFVIGSILGFLIETMWCIWKYKKYESRKGLVYGPFIPIYGIFALFFSMLIDFLNIHSDFQIFILGFLLSSVVEYVASFIQEKVFYSKSWDYRDFPFNLNGRVNLLYSILFGLITIVWYKTFFSMPNIFLEFHPFVYLGSVLFMAFLIYDVFISFCAFLRYCQRNSNHLSHHRFWKYFDRKYPDEMIKNIYANAKFV